MSRRRGDDPIVWSTRDGALCARCEKPVAACVCARERAPSGDGVVRVGRETQGRKGKGVTTVSGLDLGDSDLAELAKRLKRLCGSGGTVRDGVIELQGDHRDRIVAALRAEGRDVKRSGG